MILRMTLELLFVNISVANHGIVFLFWEGLKMRPHREDNHGTLLRMRRNCVINRSDELVWRRQNTG